MTIKVQDLFGTAPKTVLNKPFMHVQDQKPVYENSGSALIGWNTRTLNTVVTNEIPGASLSSNQITLPAGKYYCDISATQYDTDRSRVGLFSGGSSAGTVLALGPGKYLHNVDTNSDVLKASGQFTLTETKTDIVVSSAAEAAKATDGLGVFSIRGPYSIFCDVKIWQLDATIKTPVLVNDKLYPLPGNTMVTGNMHGLDYEYTSANTVTVQPGICMDSTNTVVLSASSSQVVTIGSTINQVYNLFLCNDGVVRTDTDVNGANLIGYSVRWIGFVLTDGSGDVRDCQMKEHVFKFLGKPIIGTVTTSNTTLPLDAFVPTSRVVTASIYANSSGTITVFTDSGFLGLVEIWSANTSTSGMWSVVGDAIYIRTNSGSTSVYLSEMLMKR